MKNWNWWLAWQVLRGRVQSVIVDSRRDEARRISVELTNDPFAHTYPLPDEMKGKR